MVFFNSRKKEVLDLTERYIKQQKKLREIQENIKEDSSNSEYVNLAAKPSNENSGTSPYADGFGFLSLANANKTSANSSEISSANYSENSENYSGMNEAEDRRKKLAKRLIDLTTKLEDLSNQIYHLQQRMEVIEKKMHIGN